jgi:hypothetical protein
MGGRGSSGSKGKGETIVLYHGTTQDKLDSIRATGLRSPERVNAANWPMLTTSLKQAEGYINGRENGIVIEYRIPKSAVYERGNSSALLWKGVDHDSYDSKTATAFALKNAVPGKYIKKVRKPKR